MRVAALLAGERSSGTVVRADASLAPTGVVSPGVGVLTIESTGREVTLFVGVFPVGAFVAARVSPAVLIVLRLLSAAAAPAVFLFASARSCISMVSAGALATSLVFDSPRQPAVIAAVTKADAMTSLKDAFMSLPTLVTSD